MCQLIIGHVSENSAKIWVRGIVNNESTTTLTAQITLRSDFQTITQNLTIYKHENFIGVHEFEELNPSDSGLLRLLYTVEVIIKDIAGVPINRSNRGSFNTVPRVNYPTSFILGSNFMQRNEKDGKRVFNILNNIRKIDKPAFMLHAGNQIYIDAPATNTPIQSDSYANKYFENWKSREAAEFFGRLSNYMAINDHELYYRFANDVEYDFKTASYYLREALPSYRSFQHSKNPNNYGDNKYYYSYKCADKAFFVMDTRMERFQFVKQKQQRQMLGAEQLEAFKLWLIENKDIPKFVVSTVPFITIKETDYSEYWSAEAFIEQKEEILSFIKQNKIDKLVFLTGQGNAAIHSTLTLKTDLHDSITIHELMTGALSHYDVALANYNDFVWKQHIVNMNLEYLYRIQSGAGQTDPSVMLISIKNNTVNYKAYTTRDEIGDDELPAVMLSGSFDL